MNNKVVITHRVHQEVIDLLSPHCQLVVNQTDESLSREEVLNRAQDARGLMVFMPDKVDRHFLDACPFLEVIAGVLKGYDNFDVECCARNGIWFTIEESGLTIPTAELTIGLMIAIGRHVKPSDDMIRQGDFPGWRPIWFGTGMAGSVVGIIGMGAIGRAIALRLRHWGCHIVYHDLNRLDAHDEADLGVRYQSLRELVACSDYLVPMLPYSESTHHLLNSELLGTVKQGAYLVNTGRGSVVDELAVAALLSSGRLAGYAADVYEFEDWARQDRPSGIPKELLALADKTLFTQHLGSAVKDVRKKIALSAAKKILQVFDGHTPEGAINNPDR
jgi:phosphonate dehydrogenase